MDTSKQYEWLRIAANPEEINFPSSGLIELNIHEKKICLVSYKGKLYACTAQCPHAGGKLADGYVDITGNIVCPLHRYKFNLQNGYNSSEEGFYLKTYPVKIIETGVFIGIEKLQ